ncbi:MAG: LysR family transcriptional regulator [Sphingomonadales bacterium]|nr:LysR family transcriptional regulator [Sphingomonadales bacterium]
MDTLRQLLPSINGLVVFEAAGRLASFSGAGRELGMSQAAVSYAIGRLEQQFGTTLFLREHRRVRLTEAGRVFHADVSLGLAHIQRSAANLRAVSVGGHVTLSCSTAFAAYWMVPRMQAFREDLPDIDLRIQTSDRDLNLEGEGIPLGIRGGGPADWPNDHSEMLAVEEIYPVCGWGYSARLDRALAPEDLLGHRLIHLEEPFRTAATWHEWFDSAGIPGQRVPKGLQINDYVLVLQAVIEGQGIALGWHHLVEPLVGKGVLVRLTGHRLVTGNGFHVTWPRNVPLSLAAQQVRDWLTGQRPGA